MTISVVGTATIRAVMVSPHHISSSETSWAVARARITTAPTAPTSAQAPITYSIAPTGPRAPDRTGPIVSPDAVSYPVIHRASGIVSAYAAASTSSTFFQ